MTKYAVENGSEEVVLTGVSYEEAKQYAVEADARGEAMRVVEVLS